MCNDIFVGSGDPDAPKINQSYIGAAVSPVDSVGASADAEVSTGHPHPRRSVFAAGANLRFGRSKPLPYGVVDYYIIYTFYC